MMRTIVLKLRTDEAQREALLRTMEAYTVAFNMAAEWGYKNRICNRFASQDANYYPIREKVPELNSTLVQIAIHCSCDALKGCKFKALPKREEHAGMRYSWKVARVNFRKGIASISTVRGRIKAPFFFPEYFNRYIDCRIVSNVITYRKESKEIYLGVVVEVFPKQHELDESVLGIDRGLKNPAVCSDNRFFNSKKINAVRGRYAHNRAIFQAKGTRSAKRRLKKMARREKRFNACQNHIITKQIVESNHSFIVLEDLAGIGLKRCPSPNLRAKLRTWPFYQFEQLLKYKAEERGKEIRFVEENNTSLICSKCGHLDSLNRKGGVFKCRSCGFELNADLNAARNIAESGRSRLGRLPVNQPNAPRNEGRTLKWDSGVAECRRECSERTQLTLHGRLLNIQEEDRPRGDSVLILRFV